MGQLLRGPLMIYVLECMHSQKKQLKPLYIFLSVSFELSLYSWIAGLDDDIRTVEGAVTSESVDTEFYTQTKVFWLERLWLH